MLKSIAKSESLTELSKILGLSEKETSEKIINVIEGHSPIIFEDNGINVVELLSEATGEKDPFYWTVIIFDWATETTARFLEKLIIEITGVCENCGGELITHDIYDHNIGCIHDYETICEKCGKEY